eukprot:3605887-Pleurochrysis_carterae.AAC.2
MGDNTPFSSHISHLHFPSSTLAMLKVVAARNKGCAAAESSCSAAHVLLSRLMRLTFDYCSEAVRISGSRASAMTTSSGP